MKGGVRGKYYRRAAAGTNLVLIELDLAILFPNAEAVNRALRGRRTMLQCGAKTV